MMMAAIKKKITNQKFLQGLNSIYDEAFDFNFDSEEEEDEVFTGDFCFKEKCKSTVVNDLCNVEPIAELTYDQWVHMKEQADFMIFLLWEDKQNQHLSNTHDSTIIKNSHNIIIQSPQVTSSPAMNTRSKRKMQLTLGSPYKLSPLQDITNRSITKPSPQIQKLASSNLDTSTDFALYDQLGLVNPMKLNFDDVEHSPKKSRCLEPYFTIQDSPLITDEAWDVLVSSPDVQQKTMRESFGLNARMSLDAVLMKSRLRTKTFKLDEGNSILPSLLRPNVLSSNEKENKTSRMNNKERINKACEPELKPPRKSILNVSFTIDKNSELGTATPPAKSLENVEFSRGTEKPTLNESFTINKSQDCLNEKPALNESFTINKSYVYESSEGKPVLNESFTINKSIVRVSLIGNATLNESFTVSDFSTMNEKTPVNESSTINKSVKQESMNEKPVLNESFTIDKSHPSESVNEQPTLNESFTINNSQSIKPPSEKPVLNESFTINKSQHEEVIAEKSTMNESFTVEGSQTAEVLTKKTTLNESFTLEKSTLNVSFTVDDVSIKDSHLSKSSTEIEKTTSKKKSPHKKQNSLNSSLLNKSTTGDKSCERFKNPLQSRKRTLVSVSKTPTRQRAEPPSKTTVVSYSQLNKQQMPIIKSNIVPKLSTSLQTPKTKFTLKKPNLDFNASSTLQKDNHGIVKFEEKSVVPTKKARSSLLIPNKVTRKSLKTTSQKLIPKKEESKVEPPQILQPKRKCLISTPPISRIGSVKPAESSLNGNQDAPKTRLVLPSKLPSNLIKTDTGKPMSRIPSKGPLKAFPTLGKVGEMKQSEGSKLPLSGKSKLKMFSPVKSRIPQKNFKDS